MWIRSVLGAAISDSGWCLDESVKPWRQHRYERLGKGIAYKAHSSFQYSASVAYAASRHA